MATFTQTLEQLTDVISAECKSLRVLTNTKTGDLTTLTTTSKANLVAAVNELKVMILATTSVDDLSAPNSTKTWSSSKIVSEINDATTRILGGTNLAATLDSIQELAAAINNDPHFSTNLQATLTAIGDPSLDYVASFTTGLL